MSASPERRVASNELVNPQLGGLGRRRFLQNILSASVALSVRQLCAQEPVSALETSNVNEYLESFPADIPGVGSRELRLNKGASRALIVIEQAHWAKKMDKPGAKAIELCQRQIYETLLFLIKNKGIDTVYSEGVMATGEAPADPHLSRHVSAEEQGLVHVPEIAEIGAEHILKREGLLKIKGAERKATYDQAARDEDSPHYNIWNWSVCEARENALLGIVAEEDETIAYTVFGCRHKFRNNIWSWNRAHTDKFSLLTLTPDMIARNRKEGRADSDLPPAHATTVAAGS
jgi:hypothetical protein